ncbi:LysR family transcriptional regulator [uncultured Roseobacter sp.]|uniref:LysR family transcriptional regulator n=1 Tax=uncultured Roseobacter sp. TaxID=114847 RepID=UPI002602B35D|nr:LysR family transcriptional regulator [uncultured Roseobacter sp.]
MSVSTHQVKSFAHVVREGSISGAARRLGVSQSAISQHIANLEATVGAQVLIRGRDGVTLTPVGQELFELADAYASLNQQIEERLRGHAALDHGHLTVIANAPQPALDLIARYTERYPKISVDFTLFDWSSAMQRLQERRVDIAIVTEPTRQTDFYIRPIARTRYVCYTRQETSIAQQAEVSLAEIAAHTLILPETGSLTQRIVSKALADQRLTPKRLVTMTTFPVMKEAILQGIGVGIFLEASSVGDGCLTEVPIAELGTQFTTSVVIPKHKMGLRVTQSFLAILDELPIDV